MKARQYVAGQITCPECGWKDVLVMNTERATRRRRCLWCRSRLVQMPVMFVVDAGTVLEKGVTRDQQRDARALAARKAMN